MTALNKYQRLEASALWRDQADAQRREVIASIGDATLVISDMQDRPLAHWSIPAIERANPGKTPAIFHPYGDPEETLELPEGEEEFVAAIEKLRKAIHKKEPRSGRLRTGVFVVMATAIVAGGVFWLPDALRKHLASVVPDINRVVIGQDILAHSESFTGTPCRSDAAEQALKDLAKRTGVAEIVVLPGGIRETASLPGGTVLLARSILEDHDDAAVIAGYVAAEGLRSELRAPLDYLLESSGLGTSFRLLTTGTLTPEILSGFAETLSTEAPFDIESSALVEHFSSLNLKGAPYGYAVDISGESTIDLIEADSLIGEVPDILDAGSWQALQNICNS